MKDKLVGFLTLNKAVIALFILFFVQLFFGMLLISMGAEFEWGDPRYVLLVSVLSYSLFFLLLLRYLKTTTKQVFLPSKYSLPIAPSLLLFALPLALISVGSIVGLSELTRLLTSFFPRTDEELAAIYKMLSGGVLSFIVVCIVAPLAEEFLFRGVILRGFMAHYSLLAAIFLSALLFALYHMTIVQMPAAFIIGCFYAWLYVKTASLWPSIIAHFLHNSFAFAIVNFNDAPSMQENTNNIGYSSGTIILSMLVCICGIYLLLNTLSKRKLTL